MTTSYNKSVFESIKNSLNKNVTEGLWNKVLKFEVGKTYTLRFIPNIKHGNSIYTYQQHGWNDPDTGKYTSVLSRKTFGKEEVDPIGSLCYKVKKGGKFTPEEEAFASLVKWNEYSLVNAYVVDDPSNPENNGTVKVLKIGPQIKKIIDDALTGDGADEFGARIFDLGPEGANLKIKAEGRGDYTTFESSGFYNKPVLNLDDEEIEDIYSKVHDLEQIYPVKTFDELEEILNTHFFGKSSDAEKSKPSSVVAKSTASKYDQEDEEDEIPFDFPAKKEVKKAKPQIEDVDDEIDALLDQLDS
jgi:hypothetical protein